MFHWKIYVLYPLNQRYELVYLRLQRNYANNIMNYVIIKYMKWTQNWMSWTYLLQRGDEIDNFLFLKNKYKMDNISDTVSHNTVSFKF
jgi:hypothetical protein